MVNSDGTFSFSDVQLESKNGKFYFECSNNRKLVYEVPHDTFRTMFVLSAKWKNNHGLTSISNSHEYLLEQLVVNEGLFAAMLFDESQWKP